MSKERYTVYATVFMESKDEVSKKLYKILNVGIPHSETRECVIPVVAESPKEAAQKVASSLLTEGVEKVVVSNVIKSFNIQLTLQKGHYNYV